MKFNALFLAGLVSVAGALAVHAQTPVYSVNAVGFVNVTVPAGQFAIITNPLNTPTNTLPALLPNAPNGTRVFKFDTASQSFGLYSKSSRGWSGTGPAGDQNTANFNPGEGFFIQNTTGADIVLTFVGEVAQGANLTITIPSGFSMLSPHVPQSAPLTTGLGLTAANGDRVYFYRQNADTTYGYQFASKSSRGWSTTTSTILDGTTGEPLPNVGEGFFYFNSTTSQNWVRNFSANN